MTRDGSQSLKKSVPALQIRLRPSHKLLAFILVTHGGALLLLFFTPVDLWLHLLLAAAVLSSLYYNWHQHHPGYQALYWDSDDQWWLTGQNGDELVAELLPLAYVHPLILVLRFQVQGRARSLVLLPDSADGDLLRQLRVRLKQLIGTG